MKTDESVKIYGYMRVSGNGQIDGDGFHRQHEAIEEFHRRHFPEATLVFAREEGVSGTKELDDRPMLATMLQSWDDGSDPKPEAVVVEKLDRFARDLMVQECAIRDFKERGVKVYACDHGLVDMTDDASDPTRALIRQVFGAIAQYDKSVTVLRLRISRARIRAKRGKCEGRKFFGEKNLHDRGIVHKVMGLYHAGLKSRMIARILAADGLRTSKGKPMSDRLVRRIILRWREPKE